MTYEELFKLFKYHKYAELEEEGFLTIGMVRWAYEHGAITREEAEKLGEWFN